MRLVVDGETAFVGTGSRPLDLPLDGSKPVLVLIHGAGMDHTVWVMVARHFARQGFAVLAPDLPGHGRSGGAALPSVAAMAQWIIAMLDAVDAQRAALVGHSMGSLIALQCAVEQPERCEGLALIGCALPMPVTDRLLGAAADNDHAAIEMTNTWSHSRRGVMGGSAVPGMWMFEGGERLLERAGPGVLHADLAACNGFPGDAEEPPDLERIRCAVGIIIGSADQMTPARAGRTIGAALGERATIYELPGSGHSMLSEWPNRVLDALIDSLGSTFRERIGKQ